MRTILEALQVLTDPIAARAIAELKLYARRVCERTAGHVVPTEDAIDHATEDCPCFPHVGMLYEADGTPGHVVTHFPFYEDEDEDLYP